VPVTAQPVSSSGLKIGCGIAAALGVLIAVVVGVVFLFQMREDRTVSTSRPSSGTKVTPDHGSLRDLVRDQVGQYHLSSVNSDVADGDYGPGAVDSLGMKYHSDAGTEIIHYLIAYSSSTEAKKKIALTLRVIRRNLPRGQSVDYQVREYRRGSGRSGEVTHIHSTPEILVWANGRVFAFVKGPTGEAEAFRRALPY